jgi:hypothetical protein
MPPAGRPHVRPVPGDEPATAGRYGDPREALRSRAKLTVREIAAPRKPIQYLRHPPGKVVGRGEGPPAGAIESQRTDKRIQ